MNKTSARSAIARIFVCLFVLVFVFVGAAGAQNYSILTSFDETDGWNASATPLIDSLGNVFGTTTYGGSSGCGVVYELANNGGGSYTNNDLYNFTCYDDGRAPLGGVAMDSAGNLYGICQPWGSVRCRGGLRIGEPWRRLIHVWSDP